MLINHMPLPLTKVELEYLQMLTFEQRYFPIQEKVWKKCFLFSFYPVTLILYKKLFSIHRTVKVGPAWIRLGKKCLSSSKFS